MILNIDFTDETNEVQEEHIGLVEKLLQHAASVLGIEEGSEVSVMFVTNAAIQEINRDYRDKDQPTDVISFALEEVGDGETIIIGEGIPRVLGDIIISTERQTGLSKHTVLKWWS